METAPSLVPTPVADWDADPILQHLPRLDLDAQPQDRVVSRVDGRVLPGLAERSPTVVTEKPSLVGKPGRKFRARRLGPLVAG